MQAFSVRRVRLPPLSVGVIDCEITNEISDFILGPLDDFPVGVIPSRPFNKSGTRGKLCLMNLTQRATASGAGEPGSQKNGVANANDTNTAFVKPELPFVLWYSVTSVKIGSVPCVLEGKTRRSGADCILIVV